MGIWQQVGTDPDEIAEDTAKLEQVVGRDSDHGRRFAVVIEGLADFLGGPADMPLTSMIKTLASHGHLVIAEAGDLRPRASLAAARRREERAQRAGAPARADRRAVRVQDGVPEVEAERVSRDADCSSRTAMSG